MTQRIICEPAHPTPKHPVRDAGAVPATPWPDSAWTAGLVVGASGAAALASVYLLELVDARNALTFIMMFAVGLLMSGLTLRLRRQRHDARRREERMQALYALSDDLASALGENESLQVTSRHAAQAFGGGAAVMLPDDSGALAVRARHGPEPLIDSEDLAVARWTMEHGRPAGAGMDSHPGARVICLPLRAGPQTLGVLLLSARGAQPLSTEQRGFLGAFVRQAALALARARLNEEARSTALRARTEEMRSSLLSAVSHDLRTPLAAITGAATTLRDSSARFDADQRADLLEAICEEAGRLERLLGNLLDMTRLQSGNLEVKHEWVPVEEVIGAPLTRLESRLAGRPVTVELPDRMPLVSADPVLLQQVLVNLLENATKYTPAGSPIEIRAGTRDGWLEVEVADRGPGLPDGAESRVFEKFFRGSHPGVSGVGLGLSICLGIARAHGGTLVAANRSGGGAVFRLTLPLGGAAPAVPVDEECRTSGVRQAR